MIGIKTLPDKNGKTNEFSNGTKHEPWTKKCVKFCGNFTFENVGIPGVVCSIIIIVIIIVDIIQLFAPIFVFMCTYKYVWNSELWTELIAIMLCLCYRR